MLGCGVEFLCTQESYWLVLHQCVEEIEKKKQQEIQTHKQERSTWHVSILPAISPGAVEREGRVNFCEEGKSLIVRRFLQIHSETRHQQSSPDLSLSKTKVREGKAGCICCCCQSCQVISGCYLSFLLSEIRLIYL